MSGARSSEADEAEYLLSAAAVRERCGLVLAAAERGETRYFRVIPERLAAAAERVVAVTRRRYPDLKVPYHSRWRHFDAGGVDRAALVEPGADRIEAARARVDLAIVSVLLDAGAGPEWRYREAETSTVLGRSEGLAVASLRAMQAGLFSAAPGNPWRADAAALRGLAAARLGDAFQHGPGNELAGLEGRAALLRRLGEVVADAPQWFGRPARLGNLVDCLANSVSADGGSSRGAFPNFGHSGGRAEQGGPEPINTDSDRRAQRRVRQSPGAVFMGSGLPPDGRPLRAVPGAPARPGMTATGEGGRDARGPPQIAAPGILSLLLHALGPIWPGRLSLGGMPLGDCGRHPAAGLVPFHKLSQWMAYSLVEPLEDAGIGVTDLDRLTGLAEYRNGGLFLDCGIIEPRDSNLLQRTLDPFGEAIVEWRALTVALLDRLAAELRVRLGKTAAELPLAAVLEGGSWTAGRDIARELRPDGRPPLTVASDGTLF